MHRQACARVATLASCETILSLHSLATCLRLEHGLQGVPLGLSLGLADFVHHRFVALLHRCVHLVLQHRGRLAR